MSVSILKSLYFVSKHVRPSPLNQIRDLNIFISSYVQILMVSISTLVVVVASDLHTNAVVGTQTNVHNSTAEK